MISTQPVLLTVLASLIALLIAVPLDAPVPENVPTAEPPMESPYDADGDGAMTADELTQAIEDRSKEFDWPDGYELSIDKMRTEVLKLGSNSLHQNGGEYAWLGFAHMCAWGYTWLDARDSNETETMDQAMEQLMTVTLSNPMYVYVVDEYRDIFEQAQVGNTQPLERLLRQQCNWNVFQSTPAPAGTPQATPART